VGYPPARDLLARNYPQSEAVRSVVPAKDVIRYALGPRDGCGGNGRRFEANISRTRTEFRTARADGLLWGRTKSWDPHWHQQTVESAQVAYAVWQTRDQIWAKMTSTEQGYVLDFLERFGQRPPPGWTDNWALFWLLNHAGRKALNASYDQAILDEVMFNYLDKVYCGDGWYVDAPQRGTRQFDNYLTWGFAIHVLEWAMLDGAAVPERRDELLERVRLWMMHFPYFFASDGAYCEYGRSLCYKFGRLGAPVLAYKLGVWPHPVGMLKRLVGRHLRWYVDRGAIRDDGTFQSGSPLIREHYVSTGSSYCAMQAFCGLWSLPDDDPFWTVDEEPLPAEKSNYVKVFPQPGWVVTACDGQVAQFNAGSLNSSYQDKYAKLCYSTRTPFDIGDTGAAACRDTYREAHNPGHQKILHRENYIAPSMKRLRNLDIQ
jgi:hypothetical protein